SKMRDGTTVLFDANKIPHAIFKAGERSGEFDEEKAEYLTDEVIELIDFDGLTVEDVQDAVERALMSSEYKDTAKSYILYREQRNRERKPDIFKHRINLKPYEYPHLIEYQHAIQHSYWLHTEFNYTSDIHDYRTGINDKER